MSRYTSLCRPPLAAPPSLQLSAAAVMVDGNRGSGWQQKGVDKNQPITAEIAAGALFISDRKTYCALNHGTCSICHSKRPSEETAIELLTCKLAPFKVG